MRRMQTLREVMKNIFKGYPNGSQFYWREFEDEVRDRLKYFLPDYNPLSSTIQREFRRLRETGQIYYEVVKPTRLSLYKKTQPRLLWSLM